MVFLKSILAGIGGVLAAAILLLVAGLILVHRAARRNNMDSGVGWDPVAMFGRFGLLAYFVMAFVVGFLLAWRKP